MSTCLFGPVVLTILGYLRAMVAPGMSVEHKEHNSSMSTFVLTVLNIPTEIGLNSRAMV